MKKQNLKREPDFKRSQNSNSSPRGNLHTHGMAPLQEKMQLVIRVVDLNFNGFEYSKQGQGLSIEGAVMVVENHAMQIENGVRLVSSSEHNGGWFEEKDNDWGSLGSPSV